MKTEKANRRYDHRQLPIPVPLFRLTTRLIYSTFRHFADIQTPNTEKDWSMSLALMDARAFQWPLVATAAHQFLYYFYLV
jgi:hypothetical protein